MPQFRRINTQKSSGILKDLILLVAGAVLGAVVSLGVTIIIDWLRQPKLHLEIDLSTTITYGRGHFMAGHTATYLAVKVTNVKLEGWLFWLQRSSAVDCQGSIHFRDFAGKEISARGMPVRWSYTTEPTPIELRAISHPYPQIGKIYDRVRLTQERFINVHPGEWKRAPVAINIRGESRSYGWSNHSYEFDDAVASENWRNPTWAMNAGIYEMEFVVEHRAGFFSRKFYLFNEPGNFKLRESISDCKCACASDATCQNRAHTSIDCA